MGSRRTTNNSVASLEEQNEVLDSILTSESLSKDKDTKSAKKVTKKRKTSDKETGDKKKKVPASTAGLRLTDPDPDEDTDQQPWQLTWEEAQAHVNASQFSNYVPNYTFGIVDQPTWDEESVHTEQSGGHNISDEDSDVETHASEIEEPVKPVKVPEVKITGIFADVIKERLTHVKEADRVAPKLSPEVAFVVENFLKDSVFSSEMEKLTKQYPRIENVDSMKVPRLDAEIYQVLDQKLRNMDHQFQVIQKAMMGAIGALSPLLQLLSLRGDTDKEFDACGRDLWNSVQLMSFAINGISARRRDIIKPCLAPIYAQVLSRGHETTPEWLFGGNLVETTKKCEAAKRISDKILKKKVLPQQPKPQRFQGGRQMRPYKQGQGVMRGYVPVQGYRMPAPQSFVPYTPQQMGFTMEYPRQQRPQFQQYTQFPQQQQQTRKNAPQK